MTPPAAPRIDRQADGGFTFGAGVEAAYMFVSYAHALPSGEGGSFGSNAGAFSLLGSLEFGRGFSDHFYLSFRFAAGRIFNSDDSSGIAALFVLGPSLTFRPVRPFYFAIDAMIQVASFDDLAPNISGYPGHVDTFNAELDGALLVGPALGLRMGFAIPVSDVVAFTPEFRVQCQPAAFASSHSRVVFDDSTGSVDAPMSSAFTVTGGFFLGARFFM